jgi:TPP-dependent pyruvate/acetoin dehydrogenase alpha subunit
MAKKTPQKSPDESVPSLISNSKLQQMYSTMLQCRILESHARTIIGGSSTARGKEAATVGAAIDLLPEDIIASSASPAIAGFVKRAPLSAVFTQLHLRAASKKTSKKISLATSALATQSSIAAGIAMANSRGKSGSVTVAFLAGDTGGVAHPEVFAFAIAHKLPVIYVSNELSVDAAEARPYGFPIIPVDGNDVVAVYRVAHECIIRARQGSGPSLIACTTFPPKLPAAKSPRTHDPLHNMEKYLTAKGLFTEAWKRQITRSFEKEVKQALTAARKNIRTGQEADVLDHVFHLQ